MSYLSLRTNITDSRGRVSSLAHGRNHWHSRGAIALAFAVVPPRGCFPQWGIVPPPLNTSRARGPATWVRTYHAQSVSTARWLSPRLLLGYNLLLSTRDSNRLPLLSRRGVSY